MSLLRRSVLRAHPSVAQIILNSSHTPLGRITDEFDRQLQTFFDNQNSSSELVSSLLNQSTEQIAKFKIPIKIRQSVCISISRCLPNLSIPQFLAVPILLERLPSLMLATKEEDELFEAWIDQLMRRIDSLDSSHFDHIVKAVRKLRIIHQCKQDPIVRLFEKFSRNIPTNRVVDILHSAGSKLNPPILNHIRPHLVTLVLSVSPKDTGDISRILHACTRLPIFPECTLHVQQLFDHAVSSGVVDTRLVVANLFIPSANPLPSETVRKSGIEELLSGIVVFPRSRLTDVKKSQILINSVTNRSTLSPSALAGYMRLKAVTNSADHIDEILARFEESNSSPIILADIIGSAISLVPDSHHFARLLGLLKTPLSRSQLILMLPDKLEVPEQVRRLVEQAQVEDIVAAATLVDRIGFASEPAINSLISLIDISSISQLIAAEKILSRNGLIYVDSSASESLKRVTRALFRKIRMAPIENK